MKLLPQLPDLRARLLWGLAVAGFAADKEKKVSSPPAPKQLESGGGNRGDLQSDFSRSRSGEILCGERGIDAAHLLPIPCSRRKRSHARILKPRPRTVMQAFKDKKWWTIGIAIY